jgi:diaminopimelate decarboxylase
MDLADNIQKNIVELLSGSQGVDFATPAYIYSVEQVGSNYRDLKEELGTPLVVSIKANHCPELLSRTAYNFEDGCEFASLGEVRLRAGTRKKIYINSPAYTKKMVEVASRYDAVFIIDHIAQMDIIAEVKQQGTFKNEVLLRINFDSLINGANAKPKDHFGMDENGLFEAAAKAKKLEVKVAGLHIFCGSNGFVSKSGSCVDAVEKLYDTVSEMLGYQLETINLGGGFPTDWREKNIDFKTYRESISKLKEKANVIHESGRAVFGSAGYFVTEVISVKSIGSKKIVVCDGGMAQNFLLAKTEHFIRKYDRPTVIGSSLNETASDYTFVGASCNRDDVIGEINGCLYDIKPGDKVVFSNCGAYNALYTVNKFLALKEYKEYII